MFSWIRDKVRQSVVAGIADGLAAVQKTADRTRETVDDESRATDNALFVVLATGQLPARHESLAAPAASAEVRSLPLPGVDQQTPAQHQRRGKK